MVRPLVLAGELSLFCARLTTGRVTTVGKTSARPISHPTWPTQPAIPGPRVGNISSNPLMMGHEGGDLTVD